METKPLLHTKTEQALAHYLVQPSHALLLTGEQGLGKEHVALWLASCLQAIPQVLTVPADKQMIGIEQIQSLYTQTRTGNGVCIIIPNAQLLTADAQNALLKLLEEPPKNTYFILTTANPQAVLPTIRSRCQTIHITSLPIDTVTAHLTQAFSDIDIDTVATVIKTNQARIGASSSILADKELLEAHKMLVEQAKQFYVANSYARLSLLSSQAFDREWCKQLLQMLEVIVSSLLANSTAVPARITKLANQSELLTTSNRALSQAGSPKAHMTKLALNL